MEVSELQNQLEGIELKKNTKNKILKVIDWKVNDGIKEVLLRFDQLEKRFEAIDRRFEAVDRRFEVVDRRFEAVDRRFDEMDKHFTAQFILMRWMFGVLAAIVIAALFK